MKNRVARRVSNIVPMQETPKGDQIYVRNLVGEEFTITNIQEREGDSGDYLIVEIEREGENFFFFTAHQAIMPKLKRCVNDLPLLATIRQVDTARSGRSYFDIE